MTAATHMAMTVPMSGSTESLFPLAGASSMATGQRVPVRRSVDDDWQDDWLTIYRQSGIADRLSQSWFGPVVSSAWGVTDPSSSSLFSPRVVEIMEIAGGRNAPLRGALGDLDEASEAEYPTPSYIAIADRPFQSFFEPVVSSAWGVTHSSSSSLFSLKIVEIMEISGGRNGPLREALGDLDEASKEAAEEGYPTPSDVAMVNARRLLRAMYRISPRRFEVYPTPDGEIAIDAPGGRRRSVILFCESDGGALCLVNMDGRHRRAHYSDTSLLPDRFVREALEELAQRGGLTA